MISTFAESLERALDEAGTAADVGGAGIAATDPEDDPLATGDALTIADAFALDV
jgi:hypothetical protein